MPQSDSIAKDLTDEMGTKWKSVHADQVILIQIAAIFTSAGKSLRLRQKR